MDERKGIPVLGVPPEALKHFLRGEGYGIREYRHAASEFLEAFSIALLTAPAVPQNCVFIRAVCGLYVHTPQISLLDTLVPMPDQWRKPRPMLRVTGWGRDINGKVICLPIVRSVEHMLTVAPRWIRKGKSWDREFWVVRSSTAVCEMDYKGGAIPDGIGKDPKPLSLLMIDDVLNAAQRARVALEYLFSDVVEAG